MPNNCFCPGCKTGLLSDINERKSRGEKPLSLFKSPKDPAVFHLWQRAIPITGRLLTRSDFICAKHFKKEDFLYHQEPIKLFDGSTYLHMYQRPKLKKDAVPSIFTDEPGPICGLYKSCFRNKRCRKQQRCYCPPTEKLIAQKALSNCSGIEITETRKECFSTKEKENVLKTDLSLLPQIILDCLTPEPHTVLATLNKPTHSVESVNLSTKSSTSSFHLDVKNNELEKKKKDLSTNSQEIVQLSNSQNSWVPSEATSSDSDDSTTEIFAILQPLNPQTVLTTEHYDFPSNTLESKEVPQPLTQVTFHTNLPEPQVSFTNSVEEVSEVDIDLPLSDTENPVSFNFLKVNAHRIKKINSWWTVNSFDDFIVCARWNSDSFVERKIVIYEDLKIKVILKGKETVIGNNFKVTSIQDISNLIFKVERLRLCANILKKEGNCFGFLQSYCICRRRNICLNCVKWEKQKSIEEEQWKEEFKISGDKVELIRFYITT